MKIVIKFLITSGLAFCIAEPTLDGTRWDTFLLVFGGLTLIFFILPLLLGGFRSGRGQVKMGQTGGAGFAERNKQADPFAPFRIFNRNYPFDEFH